VSTDFNVIFVIGSTEYDVTSKVAAAGISIEETLGAAAVASFRLQDTAAAEEGPLPDIFPSTPPGDGGVNFQRLYTKITIDGQTDPVFQGMVQNVTGSLAPGDDWPTYTVQCTDFQPEVFDKRLVGCPTGSSWTGPDADGHYTPVDGAAHVSASDSATVAAILSNYNSDPAIDTSQNRIVYSHCVGPKKVFGPSGPQNGYRIRTSHARVGAVVESLPPAGYMTTTFRTNVDRKQMVIHQAKSLGALDSEKGCRTKLIGEVRGDIGKLFARWDQFGWHRVTVYGDVKEPLIEFAKALGLTIVEEA
jgi:hypothetical protein